MVASSIVIHRGKSRPSSFDKNDCLSTSNRPVSYLEIAPLPLSLSLSLPLLFLFKAAFMSSQTKLKAI